MSTEQSTGRVCYQCKIAQPAENFYRCKDDVSRNNPLGLNSRCIPCYAARQKQWRAAKPGRTTKYWRKTRDKDPEAERRRANMKTRKLKARVLLAYSPDGPYCACCREAAFEFLTIDHINNDGAKHRREIGHTRLYAFLVREGFPAGFRVLCLNCNFSFGTYGYCPHETAGFDIKSIDVSRKYRRVLTAEPVCSRAVAVDGAADLGADVAGG